MTKRAIEDAKETIDMLKADISKYNSDAERLKREIADHDEDISISVWKGDQKAATDTHDVIDDARGTSPEESDFANQLKHTMERVNQSQEHKHAAVMLPGEGNGSEVELNPSGELPNDVEDPECPEEDVMQDVLLWLWEL